MQFEGFKKIWFFVGVFFVIAAPAWFLYAGPQIHMFKPDFFYQANLVSIDNFYNEQKQAFDGPQRSVASFSFRAVKQEGRALVVKNNFDVRDVNGEKIVSIERDYGVDARSGKHLSQFGDKSRNGYLLAPVHLKKGQPFTYWHINYDGPANMRYVDEQNLFGLTVFHYQTNYEGVRIDQTQSLKHLPGVPTERGVVLEPHLEVWVEPLSGHIVKYQDNTTAYFYDIKTGTRLNPWNKFSNSFTRESVQKHVAWAKSIKIRVVLTDFIVPLASLFLGLSLLVGGFTRRWLGVVVGGLGIFSILGVLFFQFVPHQSEKTVIIGIARWSSNADYDTIIAGFKESLKNAGYEEGKTIQFIEGNADETVDRQKEIARSFVAQKVDAIFSLTGVGTAAIQEVVSSTPIIFSLVAYPVEGGLIKSLQASGNNTVGSRSWVDPAAQLHLVQQLVPRVTRIGLAHRSASTAQLEDFRKVARESGLTVVDIAASSTAGLRSELENKKNTVDALYASCDVLIQNGGESAMQVFAQANRLPSFTCFRSGVQSGMLAGMAADFYQMGRLAGQQASTILEGVPPGVLQTVSVSLPYTYINTRTAEELHISLPQSVLSGAKEIYP